MECPNCEAPMTHMGYFTWSCDDCGHDCSGDLPRERAPHAEDESGS